VLYLDGVGGLVLFALWVFCLIDVITTDESLCRNLPKIWWIVVVVLLVDVGAVLWLVAGRTWQTAPAGPGLPYRGNRGRDVASWYPEYERPGRFAATSPDDDEAFLRHCRERAEEQRRKHRERTAEDEG
jgi:hypothetical protein